MRKIIIIILFSLVFLAGLRERSFSRSRDDVIKATTEYLNCAWTVADRNIIDLLKYDKDAGGFIPGSNGYDDRGEFINKEGKWDYGTDRWPFQVGDSVPSEAYAFGYMDTHPDFKAKLNGKCIAGKRSADYNNPSKLFYDDYTGIDCSGFISRCIGKDKYYNTTDLRKISVPIKIDELKQGDILNKAGSHVVLFDSWIQKKSTEAAIIHSVSW